MKIKVNYVCKTGFLFLTAAAALTVLFAGCTKYAPDGLGKVSFATSRTWVINGAGINQTWSDVVVASGANDKTTFDGGDHNGPYKADWRNNPGYKGSLFTWEAVNRYQDYLCPGDWRVPVQEDFYYLDMALGGTGMGGQDDATISDKYINIWGGNYVGRCVENGTLEGQGFNAFYWSLTPTLVGASIKYRVLIFSLGQVSMGASYQYHGISLRCVK